MRPTSQELIDKSSDQRTAGRYEEALLSALAAVDADEENFSAWWQLALSRQGLKDWKNAVIAFQKAVELNPSSDDGWAWLGYLHAKLNDVKREEESCRKSLKLNSKNIFSMNAISNILAKRDKKNENEEELLLLEAIDSEAKDLNSTQTSRLATLHYRIGNYHEAIRYWARSNTKSWSESNTHNIGLAYNVSEISQDADAVDMWRLALESNPNFQPSVDMIAKVLPRLSNLRKSVKSSVTNLLKSDELFDLYINPFQLLDIKSEVDLEHIEPKIIQKYKQRLLQEIDLEDGRVSWLDGAHIDKSRAIQACDELNVDSLKRYHSLVIKDKSLLTFLSEGKVDHFLVDDVSPLNLIKAMNEDPEFLVWLSDRFYPQFDRILSRALDGNNIILIECLLDGRRWVVPSQEHQCFENSRRVIDRLSQPLREMAKDAEKSKPDYGSISTFLEDSLLPVKLNLLPLFFEEQQNAAVWSLRSIAIDCVNEHGDTELGGEIIKMCKNFRFKSIELQQRISKDVSDIEGIVSKEKQGEISFSSGGITWRVTKNGIEMNERLINVLDVTAVSWGSTVISRNYSKEYQFVFSVSGRNVKPIVFFWKGTESLVNSLVALAKRDGFDGPERSIAKHQVYFEKLISAAFQYIVPPLCRQIETRLLKGEVVRIGPCNLSNAGIEISVKGWFSSSPCLIPWSRCDVSIEAGEVTVREKGSQKNRTSFSFKYTENAPVLLVLASNRKG